MKTLFLACLVLAFVTVAPAAMAEDGCQPMNGCVHVGALPVCLVYEPGSTPPVGVSTACDP